MFQVTENGKRYNVKVRAIYSKTIRSERALRAVVKKSFIAVYGEDSEKRNSFFTQCSLLGVLTYKAPVDR